MWKPEAPFNTFPKAALAAACLLAVCQGCTLLSGTTSGYRPNRSDTFEAQRADAAFEIGSLGNELVDRAEARVPLGGVRVAIGDFEAVPSQRPTYRQATLVERDWRATEATVRYELEMTLSQRLNVLAASAVRSVSGLDATHVLEATFQRTEGDLDLSLRLVEMESGWIVSTARRRIEDFVPDRYDLKKQVEGLSGRPAQMRDPRSTGPRPTRESDAGPRRFPVGPKIASAEDAVRRGRAPVFPPGEPVPEAADDRALMEREPIPLPEPFEVLSIGPEPPPVETALGDGPGATRFERLGRPSPSDRVVQ